MKIAINGLGRIGKLVFRHLVTEGLEKNIGLVNELKGSIQENIYQLLFDSIHGNWSQQLSHEEDTIKIKKHSIRFTNSADIDTIPLRENTIDLAIDCTGANRTVMKISPYFKNGVERALISAPVHDNRALNLVYGVNSNLYASTDSNIITGASCTTNCLAPVVKVLEDKIGIKHGSITSIHNITNTQTLLDRPGNNIRRSRSAFNSLIPTTTGSATAISLIYPKLSGKLDGHAVRVPVLNSSLTDCVFEMQKSVTVEEVNNLFEEASETYLKDILAFEKRPLVSNDFVNNDHSAVIDGLSTIVINKTQLKVYAWYDNEWAYSKRLVDIAKMIISRNE